MELALGDLFMSFLLGVITTLVIYWYSRRKQGYWKERGIPYVEPYPFIGTLWETATKPLQDTEIKRYKKYGAVYGHFEGNKPVIAIADPKILRDIFVKDFQFFQCRRDFFTGDEATEKMLSVVTGEDWKRIRTIITPTFTTGKIKKILHIFKDCSKTLVSNFRVAVEKGKAIEAKSMYGAFAMDVIASSAFSTKIDSHNDPRNEFVANAKLVFETTLNWRLILLALFPGVMKLFKIKILSPKGLKFFTDVTFRIMEERVKTGQTRNDFLQILMDTAKEAREGKLKVSEREGEDANDEEVFKNTNIKKSLSSMELVAQCVNFFLAAYDTTSTTLAIVTYYLALYPDVQEKLKKEIDDALKKNNGDLPYEAIQEMKYLNNVIAETLRICPIVARLERMAENDYYVKDLDITIPKGMMVTISPCGLHQDSKYYPNPEKFDPDRFSPEETAKRDQYVYLPFGAGPRNCVGMRFALVEMKVCIIEVLKEFRIKRCSETKVPLEFQNGQLLLQPKAVTVKLEKRTEQF